ncbi:hypothetical protein EB241_09795 [Erwinia psidii]|uniref:Uncharacterized protein n=1 Tax=Erwinia psidii TaxID=69224 RepID=A0A3N6TTC0_9GAMM|nr:hypothetical protein EB241_09795 [Erwinia psidii]
MVFYPWINTTSANLSRCSSGGTSEGNGIATSSVQVPLQNLAVKNHPPFADGAADESIQRPAFSERNFTCRLMLPGLPAGTAEISVMHNFDTWQRPVSKTAR